MSGISFSNNNRPRGVRLKPDGGYLTLDDNNCFVVVESAVPVNLTVSVDALLGKGFHCVIISVNGNVTIVDDRVEIRNNRSITTPNAWIEIGSIQDNVFQLNISGGGVGGNGAGQVAYYKWFDLVFDGTVGKGAVGDYPLDAVFTSEQEGMILIDEFWFFIKQPLVADPGAYIKFGHALSDDDALDDATGLVENLNNDFGSCTKIISPKRIPNDALTGFRMEVVGNDITAGRASIIVKTLTF